MAKGRSNGTRAARHKPKLNALQRYQRGRVIAEMRSRRRPVAWKAIAKEVGMSVDGASDAYARFLEAEESMRSDPMAVVDETIDALTIALHDSIRNMESAEEGSSARTGAAKAVVHAAMTRLDLMQRAGRAPRHLAMPTLAQEMNRVYREIGEVLARHDVGEAVYRELLELAEGQAGRMTATEGRALPSAA